VFLDKERTMGNIQKHEIRNDDQDDDHNDNLLLLLLGPTLVRMTSFEFLLGKSLIMTDFTKTPPLPLD
jgi:hypothetical protein